MQASAFIFADKTNWVFFHYVVIFWTNLSLIV